MSFFEIIKRKVGQASYCRLEEEADIEVGLAKRMPLVDQYHQKQFYTRRLLLGELLPDCESFERLGLKIFPTDVVNVLFKCKLLFATSNEHEYVQRSGNPSPFDGRAAAVRWEERSEGVGALIDRHLSQLEAEIKERTLLAPINSFDSSAKDANLQEFFDELFGKLGFRFEAFIDNTDLIEKHRHLEPGLPAYNQARANQFFCAPSIGFTVVGSEAYCFWHSLAWLRTFLNLLRIASYARPGQRDFGRDVKMSAPTFPVFLQRHAQGSLQWHEDKKESWAKIPDGCLFLSFGYRGLSNMWLDHRTFRPIEAFMLDHKRIFDSLKNPWDTRSITDIAPALDILSSATQIPDLGAKILLVYCCLEHLFVPRNASTENKKYIVGGMNALCPNLLAWFDRLYKLRCDYAHKGYVLRNDETMGLVKDSIENVMRLVVTKLSVS